MRKKNYLKRTIPFIFIVLFYMSSIAVAESSECTGPFNILIISSYQNGHKWTEDVIEGFKAGIEEYGHEDISIKVEYFDFRSNGNEGYTESFIELIGKKYPKGSIEAIYAIDEEAFSVISPEITKESSELYNIPLFFSGIETNLNLFDDRRKYIAGIYQRDLIFDNLNLMLQLDDSISTINLIVDESSFGQMLIDKATGMVENHYEGEVSLNVIQSNYLADVKSKLKEKQLASKENKEVILLAGEFQDRSTGDIISPKKTVKTIKEYGDYPIYTADSIYLSEDILGGCVDDGKRLGEAMFNKITLVIEGKEISAINNTFGPAPQWVLKYKEIYEQGINISNIPRKCNIIDKKFYQPLLPKTMIALMYSAIFLVLVIVIAIISFVIYTRKELIKQQEETSRRIEREKMQTDFVVNMSHELRTPINIILSGISVMKLQLEESTEGLDKEYLDKKFNMISQNGYRLLKLANNMIDIKKIEAGCFNIHKHNGNIIEMVENTFNEAVDYARKKDIEMIFDTEEEEVIIAVDMEMIQRIVLNLLSNAIKFTPQGGTIYTTIKREDGQVILEVKDTGIGIPKEKLDIIFHRFYQIDNSLSRVNEGSGIGLSIVKELVSLHEGTMEVESKEGEGTTFTVILPVKYEAENEQVNCKIYDNTTVNVEMADVLK